MNDLPTAVEVIDRLNNLGDHHAIAAHLRERGIRGLHDNGAECPVARYITAETGGKRVVITSSLWFDDDEEGTERYTPDNVSDFVTMFDAEQYMDLAEAAS